MHPFVCETSMTGKLACATSIEYDILKTHKVKVLDSIVDRLTSAPFSAVR